MGNAGEPYWKFRKPKSDSKTIVNPVETDEFDSSKLGMQWQWQNDYKESYGQATSMGFFRVPIHVSIHMDHKAIYCA